MRAASAGVALSLAAAALVVLVVAAGTAAAADAAVASGATGADADIDRELCCCSSDELGTNAAPLLAVLDELVTQPFFRYFRVNVKKKCPYWVAHTLCTHRGNPCKFCRCDADEIPASLRTDTDMGKPLGADWVKEDDPDVEGNVDAAAGAGAGAGGGSQQHDALDRSDGSHSAVSELDATKTTPAATATAPAAGARKPFETAAASAGGDADPQAEYVDLVRNPEGNTFYLGNQASRVWRAIYDENCLRLAGEGDADADAAPQCREWLVFYRLISGLHTSISTHIAAYYDVHVLPGDARYKPATSHEAALAEALAAMPLEVRHTTRAFAKPNCTVYEQRLRDKPAHVANMHFVFRFVVRALTRSRDAFVDPDTFEMRPALRIGDAAHDAATGRLLERLFRAHLLCSPTFNESRLLQEPNVAALLPEMKRRIANMTTITDCISCEKCRLWGKLQLLGLATAFKIVMAPANRVPHLDRRELMSLVNLARQLTDSVHNERVMCRPRATSENKESAAPSDL
jgi:hypothetical protein